MEVLPKVGQTRYCRLCASPLHPARGSTIVKRNCEFFHQLGRSVGPLTVFQIAVPLAGNAERLGHLFLRYRPPDALRARL